MENFKRPYFSTSIKEFWSRWHISLSTWFRDYVYIPLGGSKKGSVRTYVNVLIVFLISGLWHGASWMFIIWGAIHGLYQLYEKATYSIRNRFWKFIRLDGTSIQWVVKWVVTISVVLLSWVFFRSPTLDNASIIIRQIINIDNLSTNNLISALTSTYIDRLRFFIVVMSIIIMETFEWLMSLENKSLNRKINKLINSFEFYSIIIFIIIVFGAFGRQEFIYFQF
jgi:hypothetical protein